MSRLERALPGIAFVASISIAASAFLGVPTGPALQTPLSPPFIDGRWVQPSASSPAEPVWGHAEGLQVGLWPTGGPRGLFRIYAPYLGHQNGRMINYVAIEPVDLHSGSRGFSELEWSRLDNVQGLRFWTTDDPADETPVDPREPARGTVTLDGDIETLTVIVRIEPYENGAHVYVELTFRSDRPYEVGFSTYVASGSIPLAACIVTATMGNYARLRTLHLADRTIDAADLWPGFAGDGFAPHVTFTADELLRTPDGGVLFVVTPNEADPASAEYAAGTPRDWKYTGASATQYWRCEDALPSLRGCVNGRTKYWATTAPVPGGISFENVELVERFRNGAQYWFGVVPGRYEPGLCVRLDASSTASDE